MKALRRLLVIIPLAIVVFLIAVVVVVGLFAERAVKLGIEKGGSAALPVDVNVGDVHLSIMSGKLALSDLMIKNPKGYKHANLLELKSGSVQVDVRSLLSDVVNIKEIKLDGAVVVLEQKDLLHNNVKDVITALPKGSEDEAPTEGKKLHIDELVISNTTVKVKLLPLPGKVDTIPIELATIKMSNLGSDNKLSTPKLVSRILSAIARGIAEQGAGILPDDLVGGLSAELGKTLDVGKKMIEGAGDIGKEIESGLKGILKLNKKEE